MSSSHFTERKRRTDFAVESGDLSYQPVFAQLRAWWNELRAYFSNQMSLPSFSLKGVPHRALSVYDELSGDGVRGVIRVREALAFGTDPRVLKRGGAGHHLFLRDCVLRAQLYQYVREVLGVDERRYNGFGPAYAREANRIVDLAGGGEMTGKVRAFRRKKDPPDLPVARNFPFCVRPEGYYGADVDEGLVDAARGTSYAARRRPAPPTLGWMEFLLKLHEAQQFARATAVLRRSVELLGKLRESRRPALRRVELGLEHPDGRPLDIGQVVVRREWLAWGNGLAAKMVEGIIEYAAYYDLPVLADVLEDAGCRDEAVLQHLRAAHEHTASCWVLAALRAAIESEPTS